MQVMLTLLLMTINAAAATTQSVPLPEPNPKTLNQLDIPSEKFSSALPKGDIDAACQAMADHFATRRTIPFPNVLFGIDTHQHDDDSAYVYDQPDLALSNKFAFLGDYVQIDRDIDWNGRHERGDREITWWINRFFFLDCLQKHYEKTHQAKYPRYGIDLMLDWIKKNPIEQAKSSWGSWRTLEIGLRLSTWTVFIDFIGRERLAKPEELAVILESLRQQTEYLIAHSGPNRHNWGAMEQAGIGMVAMIFPEFRDAKRWTRGVLDTYTIDMDNQFYPDGSQMEMSPNYEHTVVWSLARIIYLAQKRNISVPGILIEILQRSARYMTLLHKPEGTLPMFNDGDAVDVRPFLTFVADMVDLSDVAFLLGKGKKPAAAPPLSQMYPYSGVVVMRDSWQADARCLMMNAGPFGVAHQHEDALSIDVSAFGRSFIVDPGRYTYAGGPFQAYLHGTRAHATIMVDGSHQDRRKHHKSWRTTKSMSDHFLANDQLALAVGEYKWGYKSPKAANVTHRREVLFVDNTYWVVSDVLLGQGQHLIEQNFQYTPGELKVTDTMAVTNHPDANLALLWLWPDSPSATVRTGHKDPTVGWYSQCYWRIEPAPHLTLAANLDLPTRLTCVLFPYRGNQHPQLDLQAIDPRSAFNPTAGTLKFQHGDKQNTIRISDPRQRTEKPSAAVSRSDNPLTLP